jgi:hypothetical protein
MAGVCVFSLGVLEEWMRRDLKERIGQARRTTGQYP